MSTSSLKNWCRLVRIPNLFTVPGDIVAGHILCFGALSDAGLHIIAIASLCLYIFGLITNDIADIRTDGSERPDRPLPSGAISIRAAGAASIAFLVLGLLLSRLAGQRSFAVSVALVSAIAFYNFFLPRGTFFTGPFLLALCRLLNIMLGVTASGSFLSRHFVFIGYSLTEFFYVFFVSMAASVEVKCEKPLILKIAASGLLPSFIPMTIFSIISLRGILPYTQEVPPAFLLGFTLMFFAILSSTHAEISWLKNSRSGNLAGQIGFLLRNLILIQAAACAFCGNTSAALIVACLALPALLFSKRIHSS